MASPSSPASKNAPSLTNGQQTKPRVGDGTPGPGRKKGVPNKMTVQVKEMILTALDKAGGVDYLSRQADENPTAFLSLVGKVLPLQLTGDGGGPVLHELRRIIVDPQAVNG